MPYDKKPEKRYGDRNSFSRDGAKPRNFKDKDQTGFRRDDRRSGQDGPAYPFKSSSPRRATPPRGPIPPARRTDGPAAPQEPAFQPAPENELPENLLVGRNPIREALRANRTLEKLLVAEGELTGSAREILAMAREQRVIIQFVDRSRLDQVCKGHQGMLAYASAAEYSSVEDILQLAKDKDEDALIVVLDGVTDPHNLGAIIRSAECMGAHGVILPERRAAGLGPAAVKSAAGALSYIKVAKVVNLTRTLQQLKQEGLWVTGAVMDAPSVDKVNLSGPMALVVGSEGEGISHLVKENCDQLVSLPMYGHIDSLNASVAAGILLYEAAKARHA